MKRIIAFLAALFLAAGVLSARESLKVASIFSDHMVLQREAQAPVWGWAQPGAKVTVSPSWDEKSKYTAKVEKDGSWKVGIKTPEAGGPYVLTVSCGKETVSVKDVLIGEVWVFSGQSNMDMPLRGYGIQTVDGMTEEIIASPRYAGKVRAFRSKRPANVEPQKDIPETAWTVAAGENAARLSAIAWFFATRLSDALGVPVGVIDSSWGGSKIEPYMTAESVRRALEGSVPSSRLQHVMDRKNQPKKAPVEVATTWNSRMLPLAGYAARGFIWYQGEANRKDRYYDLLQAAMVDLWRTAWGDKEKKMPFMFTTIAPYRYGDSQATVRPFFVENQLHSLKFIPNSFAAITESLGNEICIHPAKKRQVAQQFLLYALENTYGIKMGMGSGYPKPSGFEFKDGAVTIPFTNTANGLGNINNRKVKGFELAGEDHVFHPAEAEIASDNKSVVVKSAAVPGPIAVRYNFHNYADGDLENSYGVPVPCVRSDDWAEE